MSPTMTLADVSWIIPSSLADFTREVRKKRDPVVDSSGRIVFYAKELGEWLEERTWQQAQKDRSIALDSSPLP